jgi:uncharacterized membrane protein (DUF485 family)
MQRPALRFAAPLAGFAVGVGLAELFGAASLGVAFGVGQIVFAVVLTAVMVRS